MAPRPSPRPGFTARRAPAASPQPGPHRRGAYHHGDLENALLEAATDLARDGGPDAVVLREAARRVGVSATAAYRHFANHQSLMHALKYHAQDLLAAAMLDQIRRDRQQTAPDGPSTSEPEPVRRLRAAGRAYVHFALTEPGLFRTAFHYLPKPEAVPSRVAEGYPGTAAYDLMSRTLDDLAAIGYIHPARRPFAETTAWSVVHGLANLLLDGPLVRLAAADRDAVVAEAIDAVVYGLGTDPGGAPRPQGGATRPGCDD